MKIMIVSDSHAMDKITLLDVLKSQDVDYYIHCGDIFMTYESLPLSNFYLVRGNNDFNSSIPKDLTITLDNKTFFVTHGHTYGVDYTVENILEKGKEANVDVVCYGHTHAPFLETIDNIVVINPGSLSYPRGGYRKPTYALLDTDTMQVDFYDTFTNAVCNPFSKNQEKHNFFKQLFK